MPKRNLKPVIKQAKKKVVSKKIISKKKTSKPLSKKKKKVANLVEVVQDQESTDGNKQSED